MNDSKTIIHQMTIDAWSAGASLLVICLAFEAAERGSVSRFFNMLWLLTFMIAATIAVMATHPGTSPATDPGQGGHRYAKGAKVLVQCGSLFLAIAAWLLLPRELSIIWRSIASGSIMLAALLAWPALSKNE
jgi:hypothetical protein